MKGNTKPAKCGGALQRPYDSHYGIAAVRLWHAAKRFSKPLGAEALERCRTNRKRASPRPSLSARRFSRHDPRAVPRRVGLRPTRRTPTLAPVAGPLRGARLSASVLRVAPGARPSSSGVGLLLRWTKPRHADLVRPVHDCNTVRKSEGLMMRARSRLSDGSGGSARLASNERSSLPSSRPLREATYWHGPAE